MADRAGVYHGEGGWIKAEWGALSAGTGRALNQREAGAAYKAPNFQGADKACWIIAELRGDTIYRNDFIDGLTLVIHFTFHVLGVGFVAVIGW